MKPRHGQSRDEYLCDLARDDADSTRDRVARIMALDPSNLVVSPATTHREFIVYQRLEFKPKD